MALTDRACRAAATAAMHYDKGGLYLQVSPKGSKLWRMKYRFADKEKRLSFGAYPEVSLQEARDRRDAARALLRQGIDPGAEKRRLKAEAKLAAFDNFERLARHWHENNKSAWTKRYADQLLSRLENNVFPKIGKRPIREVTRPVLLEVVRPIERRGANEMARKVCMHVREFFDWAIDAGLAEVNPADRLARALPAKKTALRHAVLTIEHARGVLTATEAVKDVWWATRLASRLLALTAARPGVIRLAERNEFEDLDGEAPVWRIPSSKMKLKEERKQDRNYDFVIALSAQAVAVVKVAMAASPSKRWLFPGIAGWRSPISDSTLSKHYRLAGLTGRHVPHGWRATFSTVMNERAGIDGSDRDREVIDLMLGHMKENVEASYNRAAYLPRRRELWQAWADLLMEGLPGPEMLLAPA